MRTLESLNFDNSYARLPDAFRQRVDPTPVPHPVLAGFSPSAARLIDLDPDEVKRPEFAEYLSGNRMLPGAEPIAMKYAGHQFGSYVPQLGDGRAILLGEVVNERGERWDLHLKGSGKTMFSRFGDGRAVLRSSIREYLACEAMAALGIPTTRALCVSAGGHEVARESFEPGALVVRLAPTHVRFGSFEVFHHRGQFAEVRTLADYVIGHHYAHLAGDDDRYRKFFAEVVRRTAVLVADWQTVGFAHGVLNTDNMSIIGLTLDYGPYGFIDSFDPDFICNHSDETGRYAFGMQPRIGYWNLACLGQALSSLFPIEDGANIIAGYSPAFNDRMHFLMCQKLGLTDPTDDDRSLWAELLDVLIAHRPDYTSFMRSLGDFRTAPGADNDAVRRRFADPADFDRWADRYAHRLRREKSNDEQRRSAMNRANPKYVLRNYLAQIAIEKAEHGDYREIDRLRSVLDHPFDEQPEMNHYAQPTPDWGKRLVVSCSS